MRNMSQDDLEINKLNDDILCACGDITLLTRISELIKSTDSVDLARLILRSNTNDDTIKFYINKQSAYNNHFNMSDEDLSVLGDIEVEIVTDSPDDVINWIIT
ncbi:MAG: hypothetical protein SOZ23_01165 [Methanosphaera sp.]|uniref:hypothetical protein n=1 Tax=Methanosphaera sp. TaxID=2666342 RepID=UPI0025CEE198|nr:hypothetical protein [Methanosphaera sp.]MCI5866482.1 hypothetical protein [Methanosphaera sp.]MDD6534927.1 hypothetical protein [Methanosphaera sp.]MDY3955386.1 hypothetical protein [Methanosphaera sp.]